METTFLHNIGNADSKHVQTKPVNYLENVNCNSNTKVRATTFRLNFLKKNTPTLD